MKEAIVVTYEPDNSIKKGYRSIFREIFREIVENRWLTYQLFKRNFFAMYKQSFLGLFWPFVTPIFSIGTFVVLNHSGIFSIGNIDVPYPIYAVLGMAFWQLFAVGLNGSTQSLVGAGGMISRINFSKKSLVIASTGKTIISFLIQMALVAILFIVYRTTPNTGIFLNLP